MTPNKVLLITLIFENIMFFLLQQSMINCFCFIIDQINLEIYFLKQKKKKKKKGAYENALNIYNTLLVIYFNDYNSFTD